MVLGVTYFKTGTLEFPLAIQAAPSSFVYTKSGNLQKTQVHLDFEYTREAIGTARVEYQKTWVQSKEHYSSGRNLNPTHPYLRVTSPYGKDESLLRW